ncbi:MAG: hypothetical protein WCF11_13075, partial [Azonexus sp.]
SPANGREDRTSLTGKLSGQVGQTEKARNFPGFFLSVFTIGLVGTCAPSGARRERIPVAALPGQ